MVLGFIIVFIAGVYIAMPAAVQTSIFPAVSVVLASMAVLILLMPPHCPGKKLCRLTGLKYQFPLHYNNDIILPVGFNG